MKISHGLESSAARDSLPPQSVRLYDPREKGRIETPTDERGLVDLDALVERVKMTVDPEYHWESSYNDTHHLQWHAAFYSHFQMSDGVDMQSFRELTNRKAYLPRVFHNWIHAVTLPPPIPSNEVMQYSIDAQRVAISLAKTASLAVRLTRMIHIPAHRLEERLEQEFEHYNLYIDNARLVPKEFSLLAIEELEAKNVEEMLERNRQLGRQAIDKIPVRLRGLTIA